MAKKIDLDDIDNFDFDDDLDFNLDFDKKDDRKPIVKLTSGIKQGLKIKGKKTQLLRSAAFAALPKSYNESYDKLINLKYEASNIFDSTVKEMQPGIRNLRKLADKSLPFTSNFLPKKITDKIKKFSTVEDQDNSYSYRESNNNESEINSTLQTIFGAQRIDSINKTKEEDQHRETDRKISKAQFIYNANYQQKMASGIGKLVGYQDTVLDNYYRKSLELQHRHYFATKEILDVTKIYNNTSIQFLRDIQKNTGLPNEVKLQTSEKFTEMYNSKIIGLMQNKFNASIGNRLKKGISQYTKDLASGFNDILDQTVNSSGGMDGFGDSTVMHGEMLGGILQESAGNLAGKYLLGGLLNKSKKYAPNIHNGVLKYGHDLNRLNTHVPRKFNRMLREANGQGVLGFVDSLIGHIGGYKESVNQNLARDATAPVAWDMISRRTVVEIIPGFLSRTLDKVSDIFSFISKTKNEGKTVYSTTRESFITKQQHISDVKKNTRNVIAPYIKYYVNEIINFIDDGSLTKKERVDLSIQLANDANDDVDFDPTYYADSNNIRGESADKISELFKSSFNMSFKITNDGKVKYKIGDSASLAESHSKLSDSFAKIKYGLGDLNPLIGTHNAVGDKETLADIGLIDSKTGRINPNFRNELLRELFETADDDKLSFYRRDKDAFGPDVVDVLKEQAKNEISKTTPAPFLGKFRINQKKKIEEKLKKYGLSQEDIIAKVNNQIDSLNLGINSLAVKTEVIDSLTNQQTTQENIDEKIQQSIISLNPKTISDRSKRYRKKIAELRNTDTKENISMSTETNSFINENNTDIPLSTTEIKNKVSEYISDLNLGSASIEIKEKIISKLLSIKPTKENIYANIDKIVKSTDIKSSKEKFNSFFTSEKKSNNFYNNENSDLKTPLDALIELTKNNNLSTEMLLERIAVNIENLSTITAQNIDDPIQRKGVFKSLLNGAKNTIKGEVWLGKKIKGFIKPMIKKSLLPTIKFGLTGISSMANLGLQVGKFGLEKAISTLFKLPNRLSKLGGMAKSGITALSGPTKALLDGLFTTTGTLGKAVGNHLGKITGRLGKSASIIKNLFSGKHSNEEGDQQSLIGRMLGNFGINIGRQEDRVTSKLNDIYLYMQKAFPIDSDEDKESNREGGINDLINKKKTKKNNTDKDENKTVSKDDNSKSSLFSKAKEKADDSVSENPSLLGKIGKGLGYAAASAVAIYAGWDLVKSYNDFKATTKSTFSSNKLSSLEQLRFLQYGVPVDNSNAVYSVRYLENSIVDYLSIDKRGKVSLSLTPQEIWDKYYKAFGNMPTDSTSGSLITAIYKKYANTFLNWFYKRFLAVYIKYKLTAINIVDSDFDKLDSLSGDKLYSFVTNIQFGDTDIKKGVDPYSITSSPWHDIPLSSNEMSIKNLTDQLLKGNRNNKENVDLSKTITATSAVSLVAKNKTKEEETRKNEKEETNKIMQTIKEDQKAKKAEEKSTLSKVFDWAKVNVVDRAKNIYNGVKTNVGETASKVWSSTKSAVSSGAKWVNRNVVQPVKDSLAALINGAESGKSGYNAYNRGTMGNKILGPIGPRDLTKMTIAEIFTDMQRNHSDEKRLFAVGKYQCIPSTLRDAVLHLGIDPNTTYFDATTQERIFSDYLLDKKRPKISAYIKGKSDDVKAAMNDAASEWASLPDPNTGKGKYGNGNAASVSTDTLASMLTKSRNLYKVFKDRGMSESEAYQKAVASNGSEIANKDETVNTISSTTDSGIASTKDAFTPNVKQDKSVVPSNIGNTTVKNPMAMASTVKSTGEIVPASANVKSDDSEIHSKNHKVLKDLHSASVKGNSDAAKQRDEMIEVMKDLHTATKDQSMSMQKLADLVARGNANPNSSGINSNDSSGYQNSSGNSSRKITPVINIDKDGYEEGKGWHYQNADGSWIDETTSNSMLQPAYRQ